MHARHWDSIDDQQQTTPLCKVFCKVLNKNTRVLFTTPAAVTSFNSDNGNNSSDGMEEICFFQPHHDGDYRCLGKAITYRTSDTLDVRAHALKLHKQLSVNFKRAKNNTVDPGALSACLVDALATVDTMLIYNANQESTINNESTRSKLVEVARMFELVDFAAHAILPQRAFTGKSTNTIVQAHKGDAQNNCFQFRDIHTYIYGNNRGKARNSVFRWCSLGNNKESVDEWMQSILQCCFDVCKVPMQPGNANSAQFMITSDQKHSNTNATYLPFVPIAGIFDQANKTNNFLSTNLLCSHPPPRLVNSSTKKPSHTISRQTLASMLPPHTLSKMHRLASLAVSACCSPGLGMGSNSNLNFDEAARIEWASLKHDINTTILEHPEFAKVRKILSCATNE